MSSAGLMMEICLEDNSQTNNAPKKHEVLYKGIKPLNFDDAEMLFEMILPGKKEYQQLEQHFGFSSCDY